MTSATAHHRYLLYAFFFINIWKAVEGYSYQRQPHKMVKHTQK